MQVRTTTALRIPRAEAVDTTYLGFTLRITELSVTVLRDGRTLDVLPCVSTARRFIRGFRKAERQEAMA